MMGSSSRRWRGVVAEEAADEVTGSGRAADMEEAEAVAVVATWLRLHTSRCRHGAKGRGRGTLRRPTETRPWARKRPVTQGA